MAIMKSSIIPITDAELVSFKAFYNCATDLELIGEQHKHIEKLLARINELKIANYPAHYARPVNPREG
jgi:hypothetical protein